MRIKFNALCQYVKAKNAQFHRHGALKPNWIYASSPDFFSLQM
jgi:hypothetical protein